MAINRDPNNELRLNLYRRLLPFIQRQDQQSGEQGYILHWDDPHAVWDSGDVSEVWDKIGLDPVIQELFWVIETMNGEDLQVLESLKTLVDPLTCPTPLLPNIAASFGYQLAAGLSDAAMRTAIIGLFDAAKARGRKVSFEVYYRLLGFSIFSIHELWKKDINEANGDYSQVQFATTPIAGAPVGPSGVLVYTGQFADVPIKPGTLRFITGAIVLRDDGDGNIIGPTTQSGTINYTTGEYTVNFAAFTTFAVTADYQQVTEEWPYHAARIDLEVAITPTGGPVPLVDDEFVGTLLSRLEEVRPIHVLVRNFGLVIEFDDTAAGPTDRTACVTELDDDRDPVISPFTIGSSARTFLDQGVRGDDDMEVSTITGGVVTYLNAIFDEVDAAICAGDFLVIQAGATTIYA